MPLHDESPAPESPSIRLQPIGEGDLQFLFNVYASTRAEEMALTGWGAPRIEQFLTMQFHLQHTQYLENYDNGSFHIILVDDVQAGRLYVNRREDDIRIIDIALLPEFRGRGVGGRIIADLIAESEHAQIPLSLHVERNNPILGYYRRLAFQIEADRGIYLFMVRTPNARRVAVQHQ